ncbi:hypothetical protein ACFL6C_00110 [Myxococcota bacterium]
MPAEARSEPTGRWVEVKANPSEATLGGEGPQVIRLWIKVHDARVDRIADADVIVHVTAGEVEQMQEIGPGEYEAQLKQPSEKFPQLVVVSALDLSAVALGQPPWVGHTMVSYSARILLGGRTEPKTSMEVTIGKRKYGAVEADESGQFSVPVTVRPGEMWARGISTDEIGNASRSRINLYLPEVKRVHGFAFPSELVADGRDRGWVFVNTVGYSGAPEEAKVVATAARGRVDRPIRLSKGVYRLTYHAPKGIEGGGATVKVRRLRPGTATDVTVGLMSGAPARAELVITPEPIPADGVTEGVGLVRLLDDQGSWVRRQGVRVRLAEESLVAVEVDPGRYSVVLPPRTTVGPALLRVGVTPRSTGCHRARLIRGTGGWHVVDGRGVGCSGEYEVVRPGAGVVAQGSLEASGLLVDAPALLESFAAGARLEVEDAVPRRVVVYAGTTPTRGVEVAEQLSVERNVDWCLPTPVGLSLHEVSRDGDTILLRLETRGIDSPKGRARLTTSQGKVTVVGVGPGHLDVALTSYALPVDVVAIDTQTGTAAWLRIR